MYNTYLDDLINYKESVIEVVSSSRKILAFISNNPSIVVDSAEADIVLANNIFDYNYVDKTIQHSDAYIMVDSEMSNPTSGSMNRWYLYVQIVVSKNFNQLDKSVFRGVKGNRRDNLAKEIDLLLNGSEGYGIGKLTLLNAAPAVVPDVFTSILLTYEINDFRKERIVSS